MGQMKEFFIIFITISLLLQISKVSSVKTARIVGGTTTTISNIPYIVQLETGGSFFCGGTLVSSTFVVTAAHCVKGMKPKKLTVVAGATKLTATGTRASVSKIMVPSAFNQNSMVMDVAVLKLAKAVSGANISPIGMRTAVLKAGYILRVSGWGLTSENGNSVSNQLRTVKVKAMSKTRCTKDYKNVSSIGKTMFCASIPGKKDSCSGDSGGPAVYNGRLAGIVSWGIGCARTAYPGVYTSVRQVRTFINNAMKK